MKFVNIQTHSATLADGREVEPHGECEMTPEQYEHPEQWRLLGESFVGASAAAQKVIDDSIAHPDKFNEGDVPLAPSADEGGSQ